MGTFNDWLDDNQRRAVKFSQIVPPGTPVRSVFRPSMYGPDGQGYTAFEGYFSDIDLNYPFPIHSVNPDANTQRYSMGGEDMLVFWQGRWQSVDEIIGEA